MRLSRKITIVGMLALVPLGLGVFSRISASPPSSPFELRFVTYTNSSPQQRLALFGITNFARRAIVVFPALPQVQLHGEWPKHLSRPRSNQYSHVIALAGQRVYFTVTAPEDGEVWRLPALWDFIPNKMDFMRAVLHENWLAFQSGSPWPGLSVGTGSLRTNFTAEIR
jgi:hypothetical protein